MAGKTKDDRILVCKMCGGNRFIVRKYGLNICRRCFKDHAKEMGFEKLE